MFQSPPSPKAGSYPESFLHLVTPIVSIPSQPEGRELLCASKHCMHPKRFNPLPARRPGATGIHHSTIRIPDVSIPSQPEGRELLDISHSYSSSDGFQSPPSPKAGSYTFDRIIEMCLFVVSIPSQPEGRELLDRLLEMCLLVEFQSPPSPKAGSYRGQSLMRWLKLVSIPSQPEGRELHSGIQKQ